MDARFEEHIMLVYQAIGSQGGWQKLLDELVMDLGIRSGMINLDSKHSDEIVFGVGSGISETDLELMTGPFLGKDVWTNSLYQQKRGVFHGSEEMVSSADLLKSEFYNDLCRTVDLRYAVGCVLEESDDYAMRVAFQATHDQQSFTHKLAYLEKLLPHIYQATKLQQKLGTRVTNDLNIRALIERFTRPAAVIKANLEIVCMNAQFESYIESNIGITARGTILRVSGDNNMFAQMIQNATRLKTAAEHKTQSFTLDNGNNAYKLDIETLDTGDSIHNLSLTAPVALITIKTTEQSGIDPMLCQRQYHLTAKEIKLVTHLALGKSLDEIAEEFHRSIFTLKAQLSSIFRKTGVNSQAKLITKIMTIENQY